MSSSVTEGYHDWLGANGTINIKLQGSRDTFVEIQRGIHMHTTLSILHSVHLLQMLRPLETGNNIFLFSKFAKRSKFWGSNIWNMCLTISFRQQFCRMTDRPLTNLSARTFLFPIIWVVNYCPLKKLPCQQTKIHWYCTLSLLMYNIRDELSHLMRTPLLLTLGKKWISSNCTSILCGGCTERHAKSFQLWECLNGSPKCKYWLFLLKRDSTEYIHSV